MARKALTRPRPSPRGVAGRAGFARCEFEATAAAAARRKESARTALRTQAQSATSFLDSMNGRFQGPCGGLRPAGGENRVEVRVDTAFLVQPRHVPRRGGRRAPFQQRYPSRPAAYSDRGGARHVRQLRSACIRSRGGGDPHNGLRGVSSWVRQRTGWLEERFQQYQAVVPSGGVPTFGQQSLRLSNLLRLRRSILRPIPRRLSPPAGETQPNTVYIARFSFIDPAFQDGLLGDGQSGLWRRLAHGLGGSAEIRRTVSTSAPAIAPGPTALSSITPLEVLSHGQPHTIEFRIKLIPGEANDRVRILIDGQDVGQCFTTWETYYRTAPVQAKPPNDSEPPNLNSLQFRTSVPRARWPRHRWLPVRQRHGHDRYRPCSPGCDVTIDKQADAATVSAGGLVGYRITARNRGSTVARNLRVCDHIPRAHDVRARRPQAALASAASAAS